MDDIVSFQKKYGLDGLNHRIVEKKMDVTDTKLARHQYLANDDKQLVKTRQNKLCGFCIYHI